MKDQLKNDPDFLSKIITGDESWCYGYDPETKQQSSQRKSASSLRPKKGEASQIKSGNHVDVLLGHQSARPL